MADKTYGITLSVAVEAREEVYEQKRMDLIRRARKDPTLLELTRRFLALEQFISKQVLLILKQITCRK